MASRWAPNNDNKILNKDITTPLQTSITPSHPILSHPIRVPEKEIANRETSEETAEKAARFLERYVVIYAEECHGATFRIKPAIHFIEACQIIEGWPDSAHLERMLRAFLHHPDRLKPGTPAQFLHLAPQLDAEIRAETSGEDSALAIVHAMDRARQEGR